MRYLKTLGLAGLAVVAMTVAAGGAAASTLTQAPPVTGTVKAEAEGAVEWTGTIPFSCQKSALEWNVESHGASAPTKGPLSKFTLEECSRPMTVLKPGSFELHATSGGDGTMTWSGAELTMQTSIVGFPVHCIYKPDIDIGTFTGSATTKGTATLDIVSVAIPQAATSGLCGDDAELHGSYKLTSPDYLVVE